MSIFWFDKIVTKCESNLQLYFINVKAAIFLLFSLKSKRIDEQTHSLSWWNQNEIDCQHLTQAFVYIFLYIFPFLQLIDQWWNGPKDISLTSFWETLHRWLGMVTGPNPFVLFSSFFPSGDFGLVHLAVRSSISSPLGIFIDPSGVGTPLPICVWHKLCQSLAICWALMGEYGKCRASIIGNCGCSVTCQLHN